MVQSESAAFAETVPVLPANKTEPIAGEEMDTVGELFTDSITKSST